MVDRVTLCSATLSEDGKLDPPLGPLYIAGALEWAGVAVDFRDFQLAPAPNGFSGRPLADFLEGHESIVAISCFVDMLPAVVDATRIIRERRPDTTIVLGGPGPNASAVRLLELYPWIDVVVRGEGEETICDWVARRNGRSRSLTPIEGMAYRESGRIVVGGERHRLTELEDLPKPAYHLLDRERYNYSLIITTRGCAYRCSFCDVTAIWGNRSVYRDIDAVVDEIIELRDGWGRHSVGIVDDTFVQDRKRVRAFCRRLIERKANVTWSCFGRINLMSPELVELMAEAGCRSVFYGIDSGSPAVVARTHKMVKPECVAEVVRYSAAAFDDVEASFIWGYPFEDLDDFKMTLDLAAQVADYSPRVNVQLHRLTPLPNSPIYHEFPSPLIEPEPADAPWLLLPGLLLDERAEVVRRIVRAAPDVFPGFFLMPTPALEEKRRALQRVMGSLYKTVGSTLFDRRIAALLESDEPQVERELLGDKSDAQEHLGRGLAVSFFRRSRRKQGEMAPQYGHSRGPALVRGRNDR